MRELFSRTELLFGKDALERLSASRVAVFGLGGVGGYVVEALARSGVGALDLVDSDAVCLSNINRQILATTATVGRLKVDVAAERVAAINPDCIVRTYPVFYLPETEDTFDFSVYDYVVDAIDTVKAKISLILNCQKAGTPVISAMGAGNKTDPTRFEVADLFKTSVCPLAKVMRVELRKRGVNHLKVVYSKEPPLVPSGTEEVPDGSSRRQTPGSNAFVPPVAGLILAGEVVKDLIGYKEGKGEA